MRKRENNEEKAKEDKNEKLMELINEKMKMIEGYNYYKSINTSEINLVPGLVIPPKFKMPDFEKYNSKKNPDDHLTSFVWKIAAYTSNKKLMIHCFQESLMGQASRWFKQLDSSKICSWLDLAKAFIQQYKHMSDLALDHITLQAMERKSSETFMEYAQKWRELAAEVEPPLSVREMNTLFIDTLKPPYYDKLVVVVAKSFAEIAIARSMIDKGIKSGKMILMDPSRRGKGKGRKMMNCRM